MPHYFKAEDRPRERYFEVCDADPGHCPNVPGVGDPSLGKAAPDHQHRTYTWGISTGPTPPRPTPQPRPEHRPEQRRRTGSSSYPMPTPSPLEGEGRDGGGLPEDMSAERCAEEVRLLEAERLVRLAHGRTPLPVQNQTL